MITKIRPVFLVLTAIAILFGCAAPAAPTFAPTPNSTPVLSRPESNIRNGCVQQFDSSADYFPEKAKLTQATGFSVEYFKNYKLVTVLTPYRDAQEKFQYVLVQCGTPAPTGHDNAQIIEVPIKSIVSMSSRYLPLLKALDLYDSLVGIDSAEGVYDPEITQMAKDGKLTEVGTGAEVNIEQAISLNPDLIMTYAGRQAQSNAHPKLLEAGLKVAINAEYMEVTPLGRAEWLKFVAVFFNQEAAATRHFDAMAAKYTEITKIAAVTSQKPTVLWGVPGKDTWFMPGGKSFVATLLRDAGANYLWADDISSGNMPLSFESVFDRAANADFWLAADGYPSMSEMIAADGRLNDFAAVKNKSVWANDARISETGGNDYWESGLANPDVVLADLIKIFHSELLPDHELVYWRLLK